MDGNRNALPAGSILGSNYEVERFIGGGGFGLIYLARHIRLRSPVAIKELFPAQLVVREGESVRLASESESTVYGKILRQFRKEGRRLVELGGHAGIVRCLDYFEENNTGYLAMDYVEGEPLRELMDRRGQPGQGFSQGEITELLLPLLDGLGHVHRSGLVHLDVKPENIMLGKGDRRPVLLDFGAARNMAGHSTKSGLLVGTPPYAPFEQEQEMGDRGPWSDIYALGIMLYEMAFGDKTDSIPGSKDRVLKDSLRSAASRAGDSKCDRRFLRLIDRCVKMDIKDRPKGVDELKDLLSLKRRAFDLKWLHLGRPSVARWWITLITALALSWTGMIYGPGFIDRFLDKDMESYPPPASPELPADKEAALIRATQEGDADAARLVIDAGTDVNARDSVLDGTALTDAAKEGRTDTVRR